MSPDVTVSRITRDIRILASVRVDGFFGASLRHTAMITFATNPAFIACVSVRRALRCSQIGSNYRQRNRDSSWAFNRENYSRRNTARLFVFTLRYFVSSRTRLKTTELFAGYVRLILRVEPEKAISVAKVTWLFSTVKLFYILINICVRNLFRLTMYVHLCMWILHAIYQLLV